MSGDSSLASVKQGSTKMLRLLRLLRLVVELTKASGSARSDKFGRKFFRICAC
jgi:hypothetical protein